MKRRVAIFSVAVFLFCLSLLGIIAAMPASAQPSGGFNVNFNNVPLNQPKRLKIGVFISTTSGLYPVGCDGEKVGPLTISGKEATAFKIVEDKVSNQTFGRDETRSAIIEFTPQHAGLHQATMTLEITAIPKQFTAWFRFNPCTLQGTGIEAVSKPQAPKPANDPDKCPELSAGYDLADYLDKHKGQLPCCLKDEIKQKYEKNQTNSGSGLWFSGGSATGHVYLAINSLGKSKRSAKEAEGVLEQNFGIVFPGGATDEDQSVKNATVQQGHYYYIGRSPIPSEIDKFQQGIEYEQEASIEELIGLDPTRLRVLGQSLQTRSKPKVQVSVVNDYHFTLVATPHHVVEGTAIHGVFKDKCGELWMFQQGIGILDESVESSILNWWEFAKSMWIEMAGNLKQKI